MTVYIQGQYTVYNGAGVQGTVAMLELAVDQVRRQPPEGSPHPPSTDLGRKVDEVRGHSS
jgi:hypothetical protein